MARNTNSSSTGGGAWTPFDAVKSFPPTPEELMENIDSAISTLEYARANALLSPSTSPTAHRHPRRPPHGGGVQVGLRRTLRREAGRRPPVAEVGPIELSPRQEDRPLQAPGAPLPRIPTATDSDPAEARLKEEDGFF
ncbi:hypothetical protein QJS10_CPA06g02376 [Acorus calamus]|uniref:Uncharacterized protein n=1 Tax=Acorus calamus TaxID=4465 RepID=A0AAV9EMR8_ACOCL|nr:hypothetical protein QJS10_CPA06g02376 [Acorus calamus]